MDSRRATIGDGDMEVQRSLFKCKRLQKCLVTEKDCLGKQTSCLERHRAEDVEH